MHKRDQSLDHSHQPSQAVLIPMQTPDGLASIAQDEDMLAVLLPVRSDTFPLA